MKINRDNYSQSYHWLIHKEKCKSKSTSSLIKHNFAVIQTILVDESENVMLMIQMKIYFTGHCGNDLSGTSL